MRPNRRTPRARGFMLLELVVAIGVLSIAMLLIAEAMGAAIEYARAADRARFATAAAAEVADTFTTAGRYPGGWLDVGDPGIDGVPGTTDDTGSTSPGCQRRVGVRVAGTDPWVWVEVRCLAAGDVGGRLARSTVLVRAAR